MSRHQAPLQRLGRARAWPAQTHPPIWPELAVGAEPRGRPRKEGSLRKRIAKYAKPLARPKRA